MKILKNMNDGTIKLCKKTEYFYFDDVDGLSRSFASQKQAEDAYYIKQAYDYLGSAIRDNSRDEKISIGKSIDDGSYFQEESA